MIINWYSALNMWPKRLQLSCLLVNFIAIQINENKLQSCKMEPMEKYHIYSFCDQYDCVNNREKCFSVFQPSVLVSQPTALLFGFVSFLKCVNEGEIEESWEVMLFRENSLSFSGLMVLNFSIASHCCLTITLTLSLMFKKPLGGGGGGLMMRFHQPLWPFHIIC